MSDFLERNGLQTVAQHFKDLFLASVHRDGAEELLERLENETDFFEAPAGAKHHGAFPGGLVIHSLNVYRRLREITIRDLTPRDALGPAPISEQEEETVAILGLLHDVCKAGVYHIERKRRRNPETGVWEDYLGYTYRDPLPLGHGEKSLYQITRFIRLEDHEALAIRWHMGAYPDHFTGGIRMNENDLFNFQLEYTFTADWLAELDRQLALLLSTREGTMPLDRAFGLNMDFVDMPPEAAKSLYTAEVTEKVSKFIPEVRVQEVTWTGGNTGKLFPKVVITSA